MYTNSSQSKNCSEPVMYRSHPASGDGALRLVGESLYVTAYSGKHCMFADLQIGGNFKEVERLLKQSVWESERKDRSIRRCMGNGYVCMFLSLIHVLEVYTAIAV
jgi:hypothetical protein